MPELRPVDLEGQVALVVGGTGELGAAFVDLLGSAGAEVAVADAAGQPLERMAIRLGVEIFELDLAEPARLIAAAAATSERLGRLDLLVCVLGPPAVDPDATFAALRQAALTIAAGGRGGRILVVGPNVDLPSAAIHDAAAELAGDSVTINGLFHGPLRPPESDDWEEDALEQNLVPGAVRAVDAARAALWLVDPEVEGVSGAVVDLDAGRESA